MKTTNYHTGQLLNGNGLVRFGTIRYGAARGRTNRYEFTRAGTILHATARCGTAMPRTFGFRTQIGGRGMSRGFGFLPEGVFIAAFRHHLRLTRAAAALLGTAAVLTVEGLTGRDSSGCALRMLRPWWPAASIRGWRGSRTWATLRVAPHDVPPRISSIMMNCSDEIADRYCIGLHRKSTGLLRVYPWDRCGCSDRCVCSSAASERRMNRGGMDNKTCIFDDGEWTAMSSQLGLSLRQSEICQLILSGKSDKQIAQELSIGIPTVRTHVSRLFQRFDLQDRHELVVYMFRQFRAECDAGGCPRRQRQQDR